jgi:hypothetical protein
MPYTPTKVIINGTEVIVFDIRVNTELDSLMSAEFSIYLDEVEFKDGAIIITQKNTPPKEPPNEKCFTGGFW